MDYAMMVPFTPNPGTDCWEDAEIQGRLRRRDWRLFNFHTPVMETAEMTVEELERFYVEVGLETSARRLATTVGKLFGSPARRRTVHRALFAHACAVFGRAVRGRWNGRGHGETPGLYAERPGWYEG